MIKRPLHFQESTVCTVAADWGVRRRLLSRQQPVMCATNCMLLIECIVLWLRKRCGLDSLLQLLPPASGHGCGLWLLIIWNDLLSSEDELHLHVMSNVSHIMAHEGPFLQSNVSRALVSCLPSITSTESYRVQLSSFLDPLFSEFPLNLHEGPPFAFQSNKGLYQAYSSHLAGLSSS